MDSAAAMILVAEVKSISSVAVAFSANELSGGGGGDLMCSLVAVVVVVMSSHDVSEPNFGSQHSGSSGDLNFGNPINRFKVCS